MSIPDEAMPEWYRLASGLSHEDREDAIARLQRGELAPNEAKATARAQHRRALPRGRCRERRRAALRHGVQVEGRARRHPRARALGRGPQRMPASCSFRRCCRRTWGRQRRRGPTAAAAGRRQARRRGIAAGTRWRSSRPHSPGACCRSASGDSCASSMRRAALTAVALVAVVAGMPSTARATQTGPITPPSLRMFVHHGGQGGIQCLGVSRACVRESRVGVRLGVWTSRMVGFVGARLRLERSWRRPGSTRLRSRAPYRTTMRSGSQGSGVPAASIPLGAVLTEPGLWCFRAGHRHRRRAAHQVAAAVPSLAPARGGRLGPGHRGRVELGDAAARWDHAARRRARAAARANLMVGNYEGTLSRGGRPRCGGGPPCFIFQAPPERARNLARAGFDVMTLANNHALDKGADARRQTIAALDAVGVRHAGMPGQVAIEQVADTRVAIVGFSPYPGHHRHARPACRACARASRGCRGRRRGRDLPCGPRGDAGARVPRGSDAARPPARRSMLRSTRARTSCSGPVRTWCAASSAPAARGSSTRPATSPAGTTSRSVACARSRAFVRVTFDPLGRTRAAAWDPVLIAPPGMPRVDRSGPVLRRVARLSRLDFGRAGARIDRRGRLS